MRWIQRSLIMQQTCGRPRPLLLQRLLSRTVKNSGRRLLRFPVAWQRVPGAPSIVSQQEIEDYRLRLRPERLLVNIRREQEYLDETGERMLLMANRECERKRMVLTTDKTQLAGL